MSRGMIGERVASSSFVRLTGVLLLVVAGADVAFAEEKASHQVSPFYGSMGYSVPIVVPPYHGLEPRLSLTYTSESGGCACRGSQQVSRRIAVRLVCEGSSARVS